MDRAGERKGLDERIYAALSYANVHPDMEAYARGIESQAEFDAAVAEITEIDGGFELDIPSLEINKLSKTVTHESYTHDWYAYPNSKSNEPIKENLEIAEAIDIDNDNCGSIPTMYHDEYMTESVYETFDIQLYGDTDPLHAA